MAEYLPDEPADEEDIREYEEQALEEIEGEPSLAEEIQEAVGAAAIVRDHLARDEQDVCGYCGQHFGPDDVVVERELLGRTWQFCDEQCLADFRDKSDFRDEPLSDEVKPHPDDVK